MNRALHITVRAGAVSAWATAAVLGFGRLWQYEGAAGPATAAPLKWPTQTKLGRATVEPTLVMLMHPRCPCSRATVDELAKIVAHCRGKLLVRVLMVRPMGAPQGWEKTDLWRSAAAIPGVTVVADPAGEEARRFHAVTSGEALLYSASGKLLFAGGITQSRGHSGDNVGRSIIAGLVSHELQESSMQEASTPIYGCPLFSPVPDGKAQ